jgi:hypothetical protein
MTSWWILSVHYERLAEQVIIADVGPSARVGIRRRRDFTTRPYFLQRIRCDGR